MTAKHNVCTNAMHCKASHTTATPRAKHTTPTESLWNNYFLFFSQHKYSIACVRSHTSYTRNFNSVKMINAALWLLNTVLCAYIYGYDFAPPSSNSEQFCNGQNVLGQQSTTQNTVFDPHHKHNKSKYINHVEVNWSEMWPNYYTRILNGYQIIGTNRQ